MRTLKRITAIIALVVISTSALAPMAIAAGTEAPEDNPRLIDLLWWIRGNGSSGPLFPFTAGEAWDVIKRTVPWPWRR
jgi:hypothetical protein